MPQDDKEKENVQPEAQQEPEAPTGPTVEELNATLQAERQRAMAIDYDRQRLATELYTRREAPTQSGPDPYEHFADNVLTGDPKENKRVLQGAVRSDVQRGVNAVRREVADVLTQQKVEFEAQRALDRVMNRFPELNDPANQSKFGGLITKAQIDAQAQGLVLDMAQIAERAAREYAVLYGKQSRSQVPHVEGASIPGANPLVPGQDQPVVKNGLEEAYGMTAGTIEPIDPAAMKKVTRGYVKEKNDYIRKKGTGSSLIINAVTEIT